MEEEGVIRRSDSPWASPLHVVPEIEGSWRACGDYHRLNSATEDDRYPLPHVQAFNEHLCGKRVFFMLDLKKGFHQIPMKDGHIAKTAVITPFGLFNFLRMLFGLKNAPQAFQRLIDCVLRGLDCTFVYLDDVLVASSDQAEHLLHLDAVFKLLSLNGLILNNDKCVLGKSELTFLGHKVSANGIEPKSESMEAIHNTLRPTTRHAMQSFLGMVNFYCRFLPNFSKIIQLLHDAVTAAAAAGD
jgi:cleavage and polyadenylation specificity factor subunit 1